MIRGTTLRRSLVLSLAAVLVAGCKDEGAEARARTQDLIETASADLELVTLTSAVPGDESFDARRRKLESIVNSLGAARDGGDGQQAAAAMITAFARRELASMRLAEAEIVESDLRREYDVATNRIDEALRLAAMKQGRQSLSLDDERAALHTGRTLAEQRLREESERMAAFDGPIAEHEAEIERDSQKATQLETESVSLRREAAAAGHYDGLDRFLRSVDLRREADQYEYQVAQGEIALDFDLRPEHELAGTKAGHLRDLITEIRASESALDKRAEVTSSEIRAFNDIIDAHAEAVDAALASLSETVAAELDAIYDDAMTRIDQAIGDANRAAQKSPRNDADAARLAVVQGYELKGGIHRARARGLADRIAMMEQARDLTGENLNAPINAARQALEAEEAAALEAYNEASSTLGQVSGRTAADQIAAFQRGLQNSIAALSGQPMMTSDDMGAGGASSSATPTGGAGGGLDSPEAIVALLDRAAANPLDTSLQLAVLDAIEARTPHARRLVAAQRKMLGPSAEFMAALTETFGDDVLESTGMMMGADSTVMKDPTITDQSDDSATISVNTAMGPQALRAVKLGDQWRLDGDSVFASVPADQAQQATQMADVMAKAMSDLTTRIRAGEFSSAMEVMQAMGAAMMGGAPGG